MIQPNATPIVPAAAPSDAEIIAVLRRLAEHYVISDNDRDVARAYIASLPRAPAPAAQECPAVTIVRSEGMLSAYGPGRAPVHQAAAEPTPEPAAPAPPKEWTDADLDDAVLEFATIVAKDNHLWWLIDTAKAYIAGRPMKAQPEKEVGEVQEIAAAADRMAQRMGAKFVPDAEKIAAFPSPEPAAPAPEEPLKAGKPWVPNFLSVAAAPEERSPHERQALAQLQEQSRAADKSMERLKEAFGAPAPVEMVELGAKAMHAAEATGRPWGALPKDVQNEYRHLTRAAIAAATSLSAKNGVERATVEKCIAIAKSRMENQEALSTTDSPENISLYALRLAAWNEARVINNALHALLPVETEGKS